MDDEKVKEQVLSTFETVARAYDKVAFFKESSRHIADMLKLKPGTKILDVACGTGNVILQLASSFPKTECVGIDISQAMLDVAEDSAKARGITNTRFFCQDIESLTQDTSYDLITCSYALFFLPNPVDTLRLLVSLLSDDGELIFTSFTDEAFTPSSPILIKELQAFGIALEDENEETWRQLTSEEEIKTLCKKAGLVPSSIQTLAIRYPLDPAQWWELKMSTGYRGMINELSEQAFDTVKKNYFSKMHEYTDEKGEVMLIADTLYTRIVKPIST